jgi:hypothetical protein
MKGMNNICSINQKWVRESPDPLDTDVVFRTLEEDIPAMIPVVKKIISDLGHRSA